MIGTLEPIAAHTRQLWLECDRDNLDQRCKARGEARQRHAQRARKGWATRRAGR